VKQVRIEYGDSNLDVEVPDSAVVVRSGETVAEPEPLGNPVQATRLALAEACLAEGDTGAGEAALRRAVECVRARASDIPEAGARERFLRQVPENARTLELARQRWGDAAV